MPLYPPAKSAVLIAPIAAKRQDMRPYLTHDYIFRGGVGDQLQLNWWEAEQMKQVVLQIGADGAITAPLAGRVQAQGKALFEIEASLRKRFQQYYQEPQMTLQWKQILSAQMTVLGCVRRPGSYAQASPVRLSALLAMAGGVRLVVDEVQGKQSADLEKSFVRRGEQLITPDISSLLRGSLHEDIWILPGDHVFVPARERMQYIILGEVSKPGRVVSLRRLHLFELIATVGGMKESAGPDLILIKGSIAKPTAYRVPYRAILAGKAQAPWLEPGDVLYVPPSDLASFERVMRRIMPLFSLAFSSAQTAFGAAILAR
ncbi:MAG: polysaccharide biosynthesis/export family protein [Myxococcales bacterium]|nr:polysaccharide biosynthesis/export family protein [Myxococcales bacterium]MCB9642590.1 polysaccharide biosynthesis/export family protein [Myxococcales bacterium]